MATYKAIKGITVQDLASDPSTLIQGEVWYNSTSETLKAVQLTGSWAAGGTMINARGSMASGGGAVDAMWLGGGIPFSAFHYYNGTGWTAQTNLPAGGPGLSNNLYVQTGIGIQDALFVGHGLKDFPKGASPDIMLFNGSSWASSPAGPDHYNGSGWGTTAAAMMAGGNTWPNTYPTALSYTWNGSAWASDSTLPVARQGNRSAGVVETAGFIVGGNPGSLDNTTEWNGTSWSESGVYPTQIYTPGCGGPISAAIAVGGSDGSNTAVANQYDGSTWSSMNASLPQAQNGQGASAANPNALTSFGVFGGSGPGGTLDTTLEMSMANAANTITTS